VKEKSGMRGSKHEIPVAEEMAEGELRVVEWGGMTVEWGTFRTEADPAPLFRGLPDDRCQCPHWGYVLKGRLRYRYADREDVYSAGDVYYAPAGHTPVLEAGAEWIEFSRAKEYQQTMDVAERNMAALRESQPGA
jgi:hypothetical protein